MVGILSNRSTETRLVSQEVVHKLQEAKSSEPLSISVYRNGQQIEFQVALVEDLPVMVETDWGKTIKRTCILKHPMNLCPHCTRPSLIP